MPVAHGSFDADQHDGGEVRAILFKDAPHRQNALSRGSIAAEIPGKSQRAGKAFIRKKATRLEQSHRAQPFRADIESFVFQEGAPFRCRKRSRTDMNDRGKRLLNFGLPRLIQIVRNETEFMNAIPSARFEDPARFVDNLSLLSETLHREHCFPINNGCGPVPQRTFLCASDKASLVRISQQLRNTPRRRFILLHGDIRSGA